MTSAPCAFSVIRHVPIWPNADVDLFVLRTNAWRFGNVRSSNFVVTLSGIKDMEVVTRKYLELLEFKLAPVTTLTTL